MAGRQNRGASGRHWTRALRTCAMKIWEFSAWYTAPISQRARRFLPRKHRCFDVESWELDDLPVAELNGGWVCGNHRAKGRIFICQVLLPEGGIHCKFWLVENMPKHGIWDYWWFLIGCNWFLTAATFSPKNGWCGDGKKNCRHLFMVFTGVY